MAAKSSPVQTSAAPPEWLQQVVTLLLLVHLICVAVALSSYQRQSLLQARLLELFAPYTRTLNFAPLSAPYHLSAYDPIGGDNAADDDLYLEFEYRAGDGSVTAVDLKDFGLATPDGARRFRSYAAELYYAVTSDDSNTATLFAQAAGAYAMRAANVKGGVLRLKRHMSQPRRTADLEAGFPPHDPYAAAYILTLYEADVSFFEDDPVPTVNKREGIGQTAPVRPTSTRSGTGSGAGDAPRPSGAKTQ